MTALDRHHQPVDLQSFHRTVGAARAMRATTMDAFLADMQEAGHCLDAPDLLPAGSADHYCLRGEA